MAQKKIIFKDRISYLDEIQFESNLIPGAGSYNPRVFFDIFSNVSKLRGPRLRLRLRYGGRSMSKSKKRSLRRVRIWGRTILCLLTTICFKVCPSPKQTSICWARCRDSRLLQVDRGWTLGNTMWFRNGRGRILRMFLVMVWRCFLPKRPVEVFTIIDFYLWML